MYQASDLFRKAYAYATKNYDFVAILSAKYGLLLPDDVIGPYDLTLNDMNYQQRKEWADKAFDQMENRLRLREFDKIFFHAGKKYREHLIPKLENLGIHCEAPLKHLGIGKQKAWYKENESRTRGRYFLLKNLVTFCFFIFGAILIVLEIPGLHELVLFLDALILAFLIFDIDVPRRVGGMGRVLAFRIFLSGLGAAVLLLSSTGIAGGTVIVAVVLATVLTFPSAFWKNIEWETASGRVQHTYKQLLSEEARKDPKLEDKKILLFRKTEIAAIDFLKVLALIVHTIEACFVTVLVSLIIAAISYNFFMELGLFALFGLWTLWSSWNVLLRRKFSLFLLKREKLEEETWRLSISKFLNPRGILYLYLFVPSIVVSIIMIILCAGFLFFLVVYVIEHSTDLLVLIIPSVANLIFIFNLSINLIYPVYIATKLIVARAYRSKHKGYKKDVHLLPSPRLCLLASLFFSAILHLPTEVLDIPLLETSLLDTPFFGSNSLGFLLATLTTCFSTVIWLRSLLLMRGKVKEKMNRKLENQLAFGVILVLSPFFKILSLEFILGFALVFAMLVFLGDLLSAVGGSEQQKREVLIEGLMISFLIPIYLYFFKQELMWLTYLCILLGFVAVIGLLPDKIARLVIRNIFMIREVDSTKSAN